MFWDDHVHAHFHAKYGEYERIVHIHTVLWKVNFRNEHFDM